MPPGFHFSGGNVGYPRKGGRSRVPPRRICGSALAVGPGDAGPAPSFFRDPHAPSRTGIDTWLSPTHQNVEYYDARALPFILLRRRRPHTCHRYHPCPRLITILAAPVIARLYGPEAFGFLAIFTSITSIIGVVACMRYELAIMLPKTDEEAANLLGLCLLCVAVVERA
ncbi:hypothetical protein [Methanoculleus sp.]|uniref:lipopolysaccharide biosynthesis protein n=1 Tax=Methanoculleus sp. TaxID=90427 RepID=UPI002619AE0E|nr:hypothetical protein [Methanoculleus sp.]MDI6867844.1 hypothetical protein [Methanoculleus sp.]